MSGFFKKNSKLLSAGLVAFAKIGFAWATYYDWQIASLEGTVQDQQLEWDELYREMIRGTEEYYGARQQQNHAQVLEHLKAPRQVIEEASRGFQMRLKQAILMTKPDPKVEKEIAGLQSYQQLFPVFEREQLARAKESNELKQTIISNRSTISSKETFRNVLYIGFLILNTIGLLLGLAFQSRNEHLRNRAERRRESK